MDAYGQFIQLGINIIIRCLINGQIAAGAVQIGQMNGGNLLVSISLYLKQVLLFPVIQGADNILLGIVQMIRY